MSCSSPSFAISNGFSVGTDAYNIKAASGLVTEADSENAAAPDDKRHMAVAI